MSKIKKIFGYVGVTALIWLLSRIVPSVIGALVPNAAILRLIAMLVMLPIGWAVAKSLSKGKFPGCIRTNLYIFMCLEGIGALEVISYIATSLMGSTGRYSYDPYGIAYSDYATYYGGILLYEIIYVILCICLVKRTESQPIAPNPESMTQTKRSSSVEAVQHKDGDFYIKLRSGGFYLYKNFPRSVYLQMMNSPSMGDYYRQHIEGKYPSIRL